MTLIKSVLGKLQGSPEGADAAVYNSVRKEFAKLEKLETGLSKRAAGFVCAGEDESVLLTLQQQGTKVVEYLGLNNLWQLRQSKSWPLRELLPGDAAWNAELIYRLARVYDTATPALGNMSYGWAGTKAAPSWLRLIVTVMEWAATQSRDWNVTHKDKRKAPSIKHYQALLNAADESEQGLVDIIFHRSPSHYSSGDSVDSLKGVEEYLRQETATVSAAAKALDAAGRVQLIRTLGRFDLVDQYLDFVYAQGIGAAKTAREAARSALQCATPERLLALGAEAMRSGSAAERGHAATLLAGVLKEQARPLLEEHLEREKGKRVRETIKTALTTMSLVADGPHQDASRPDANAGDRPATSTQAGCLIALDGSRIDLPPLPELPEPTVLPRQAFEPLQRAIQSYNEALAEFKKGVSDKEYRWMRDVKPVSQSHLKAFQDIVNGAGDPGKTRKRDDDPLWSLNWGGSYFKYDTSGVGEFFASPHVSAWHLLRLLSISQRHNYWPLFMSLGGSDQYAPVKELGRRINERQLDFRHVADIWCRLGGTEPLRSALERDYYYMDNLSELELEDLWWYFAQRLDLFDEAFGLCPQRGEHALSVNTALDALALFPKTPARYLAPLLELATGSRKSYRRVARTRLAQAPHIDAAIAEQLKDGKQDVRAGAADWLAERQARDQVPALEAALNKERSEIARAAMLTALDRLGSDISAHFEVGKLLSEAGKGLKKINLKSLAWFPFDAVPAVRWRDGTHLDAQIVKWWIAVANKLKQPGGNALFDLYLDRLDPADAQTLGLFILRAWIGHDTLRPSEAQAHAFAEAHVDGHFKSMVRWMTGYTRERAFAELKNSKLGEYLQSGINNKGILGLASRCAGADLAQTARAYLKNHGGRPAQCKAMLECLAANPAPAAIQVVLDCANRFKAKTVQEHAQALIDTIAERRGWSAEQLADRTVPTGGFDPQGVLSLDCGADRLYHAVYDQDGKIQLRNPAGKNVKALPGARHEDEQAVVKAAKKSLSNARKEVKQVLSMQAVRLFEAMCLERTWSPDEWDKYINRHPLVGRMAQRLVWLGLDGEGAVLSAFRPLEDASLSDAEDSPVGLEGIDAIKLAHQTLVGDAQKRAWLEHLQDYEIEPLFDQFSRPLLTPDATQGECSAIEDRKGHLIEAFKLRGIATKLGYSRGEAEDGGVFISYTKRYNGAGLIAAIEFTGNTLPEENVVCALLALKFYKIRKRNAYWGVEIPLTEVPPVLLSELWNDFHQIAAAGTGFDAAWEKKAEYW